jgi:hypothetical protein
MATPTRVLVLVPLLMAIGCGAPQAARRQAGRSALLLVDCSVPGARIYVDETFVGLARELGVRPVELAAGARRLEVRAEGYFTVYRDLELAPGEQHREQVRLRQQPDEDG